MLIRKNTKAFKTILEIVTACRDRPDREQLIRVYITKAGDSIQDRISVEGIQGEAGLFYEMSYQAVFGNLKSSNHQLHHSDEIPGIYFFHSSSNKVWDETPFEFDEAIKKEFGSLPELPALRKKEEAAKFAFPAARLKKESSQATKEKDNRRNEKDDTKKQNDNTKKEKDNARKETKVEKKKSTTVIPDLGPKQPDYNLKHEIHFTGFERIVYRQGQLTKRDVLNYYNNIAEYLLPYLQDRPQVIRLHRDGHAGSANTTLVSLKQASTEEIPDWLQTATIAKGKSQEQLLLCNDREHLLYYVQIGCLEFNACHSRRRSLDSPDYVILEIESPEYELDKAIDVTLVAKTIFDGLQLPSFVKTDGTSGLHVYIPLDSKSGFEVSKQLAEYLCKLIRLKIPDFVTLEGSKDHAYGKVTLDYSMNEPAKGVVAPYSIVSGQSANVATPLLWEEVKEGLKAEAFNHETIFKRLKGQGDPFQAIFKKKASAQALLERMEQNYSFLFL